MAKRNRYSTDQVVEALRTSRGLVSMAAQKLRCDVDTVQRYCRRYPEVEAAKRESRVSMLDLAESRLWDAIDRGEGWAIAFCLKTIGRSRGYGERLDIGLTIQAAAARVAAAYGFTPEAVLQEAQLLLMEAESDVT
jgi:hypothetical protein